MDSSSAWLTVVQGSSAALTPIIAILGGWIAWQQVRINKNKLKLDRFEKRFEVYETTMEFLGGMLFFSTPTDHQMERFLKVTRGAQFMLSPKVALYLEEIRKNAVHLRRISGPLSVEPESPFSVSESERSIYGDEKQELLAWFKEQMEMKVNETFAPFLSVEEI